MGGIPDPIGAPIEAAVDTPALLVDADALESNITAMKARVQGSGIALRPHTKTHKMPLIAHMQIKAGAVGVCCAKLSEAEVMAAGGVPDILITTAVIGAQKIKRLMALTRVTRVKVVADSRENVEQLAAAATRFGTTLDVLIEIDVGQGRCGLPPDPAAAVAFARHIAGHRGLRLRGVQGYQGSLQQKPNADERKAGVQDALDKLDTVTQALKAAGFTVDIRTGGGTGTLPFDLAHGGLNELQPGSYVFMDRNYASISWDAPDRPPPFKCALTVLATVISRSAAGHAVLDVGTKAINNDVGPPIVKGNPKATYRFAGDEHGILNFEGNVCPYAVGDKVQLLPAHCDTTVGLYDRCYAARGGRLEAVWNIPGRGKTQ